MFKFLHNSRLLAVFLLGFSAGLPLALTGSTLQAWFTQAQINVVTIGALSLLGIPYTLKFLWAPAMDYFSFPFLGRRRGWIMLTQLGLILTIALLAELDPMQQAAQMGVVALLIAFFSASQDVAIDAYRTDILHAEERGLGAAYYVFAYRLAMLVSGGLAFILADFAGWRVTYQLMCGLMVLSLFFAYRAPKTVEQIRSNNNFLQTVSAAVSNLLQHDKILFILVFIVLYKFGDALALSLITNFLLHGLGFSLTEVGLAYKVVSFFATILGAFVGGVILVRWNIYRALLVFGLAQALSNLTFIILALVGKHFIFMASVIFIENFCSGLSTAALLAFMMSLCDQRFSASQFAILSAIASLGRVFLGPLAGLLVTHVGWVQFFIWSFVLCLPGLIMLVKLKDEVSLYAHATAN